MMKKKVMALMTAGMVTVSTLTAGFATSVPVAADDYGWGDLLGDLCELYDYDQQMQDAGLSEDERDAIWALGLLGGLAEVYEDSTYEPEWLSSISVNSESAGYTGEWWTSSSGETKTFSYYLPENWDKVELTADAVEQGVSCIIKAPAGSGSNGIVIYHYTMSDVNNITDLARKLHSSNSYQVNGVRNINDLKVVDCSMKGVMSERMAPAVAFQTPHNPGGITIIAGFYENNETDRSTVLNALCTVCSC